MMARGDRLFAAVPLTPRARDELAARLPADVPGRMVVPEKWHFTLRFLGDTAPAARDRLLAELHRESFGARFTLRLAGLGAFPDASHARVLWVGVQDGADRLTGLARMIADACTRAGVSGDERPYSPHLTLSRLDPPRDVRALIAEHRSLTATATASEVVLMRSMLGKGPPRYTAVERFPLIAPE